jgi:hypothetical protein
MAMTRPHTPDLVTLAALHAALDGVVEVEALLSQVNLPISTHPRASRAGALAAELRGLLADLLQPNRGP